MTDTWLFNKAEADMTSYGCVQSIFSLVRIKYYKKKHFNNKKTQVCEAQNRAIDKLCLTESPTGLLNSPKHSVTQVNHRALLHSFSLTVRIYNFPSNPGEKSN